MDNPKAGSQILVAIMVAIVGASFIHWGMQSRAAERFRMTWEPVPGVIREHSVNYESGDRPYCLRLTYDYNWQGQSYTGYKLGDGWGRFYNQATADRFVAELLAVDSAIVVYVNPDDPYDAALIREMPDSTRVMMKVVTILGFGACAVAIVGIVATSIRTIRS